MTAHNSRKASNSRNESNNKTAQHATKSRDACKNSEASYIMEEANSSRDNRNITVSTAEGETRNNKDARNSRD
jgi:hypothetical protein